METRADASRHSISGCTKLQMSVLLKAGQGMEVTPAQCVTKQAIKQPHCLDEVIDLLALFHTSLPCDACKPRGKSTLKIKPSAIRSRMDEGQF